MEQENTNRECERQYEQMIEFITKAIQQIGERKLRNVYNFVLHI